MPLPRRLVTYSPNVVIGLTQHWKLPVRKQAVRRQWKSMKTIGLYLDNPDIDAIFIGTVDHWHTQIAVDALDAGKHVYCEKPMTRYFNEGFQIYDKVKETGKKFQDRITILHPRQMACSCRVNSSRPHRSR